MAKAALDFEALCATLAQPVVDALFFAHHVVAPSDLVDVQDLDSKLLDHRPLQEVEAEDLVEC